MTIHATAALPGPTMTRERPGAKPLDALMRGVIEPTLARRGLSEAGLIADWPAIVGERSRATPAARAAVAAAPGEARPRGDGSPATLVLRVDGAFALEAQHNAAVIVERVNAHLGWRSSRSWLSARARSRR